MLHVRNVLFYSCDRCEPELLQRAHSAKGPSDPRGHNASLYMCVSYLLPLKPGENTQTDPHSDRLTPTNTHIWTHTGLFCPICLFCNPELRRGLIKTIYHCPHCPRAWDGRRGWRSALLSTFPPTQFVSTAPYELMNADHVVSLSRHTLVVNTALGLYFT